MAMIPRAFIDDLIARIDLVELINASVPLKRSGKNYMACCPFHKEKTPSFSVSPEGQFYHCFGCGQSGNAISFLMDYQRMDFVESIENLASRVGVEVPREADPKQGERYAQSKSLYDLLEKASQFYQQQLRQAEDRERAVNYLKGRGLSGQIAKQFQIGYASPGWNQLINAPALAAYSAEQLVLAGLTIAKNEQGTHERSLQYDRFRDRIIFPIRDTRGRCIGFGGRVLGDELPKYLNSPETPVFNKSKELYGFYEAKQSTRHLEKVVVVEGYMDVIALAQAGISNAVATMGTSIGSDHLHLLFRSIKELVFCFDGDKAGRQAAERALHNSLPFLQDGRQIRFLFLSEGEDPDTLVRREGPELFQHKLNTATPLSDFLFDYAGRGLDLNTMDGRASLAKQATPLINQMPKSLFYEMMIARLAELTQLDRSIISQSLKEAEAQEARKAQERAAFNQSQTHYSPASGSAKKPTQGSHYEQLPPEAYEHMTMDNEAPLPSDYHVDDQDAPEPRISTVNRVLTHLLRQPELAMSCEIPEEVYKLKAHNIDLLIELINYIKSAQHKVNTAMILGHWHDTAEGYLLASLAATEPLLDAQAWEKEFEDAMNRLIEQFFSQELSKIKGTCPEEKARYHALLEEKARLQNAKASSS